MTYPIFPDKILAMISNILEYALTDAYFLLWLYASKGERSSGTFTHENWLPALVEQFEDKEAVPSRIRVDNADYQMNRAGQFHTGTNKPTVTFDAMHIFWESGPTKDVGRKHGPAKITLNKVRKWHHEGVLHRRRGDALICDGATFSWAEKQPGAFHREGGPYQIALRTITVQANKGKLTEIGFRSISTSWITHGGQIVPESKVRKVLSENNLHVNWLAATDSVFADAADEFVFWTELDKA